MARFSCKPAAGPRRAPSGRSLTGRHPRLPGEPGAGRAARGCRGAPSAAARRGWPRGRGGGTERPPRTGLGGEGGGWGGRGEPRAGPHSRGCRRGFARCRLLPSAPPQPIPARSGNRGLGEWGGRAEGVALLLGGRREEARPGGESGAARAGRP